MAINVSNSLVKRTPWNSGEDRCVLLLLRRFVCRFACLFAGSSRLSLSAACERDDECRRRRLSVHTARRRSASDPPSFLPSDMRLFLEIHTIRACYATRARAETATQLYGTCPLPLSAMCQRALRMQSANACGDALRGATPVEASLYAGTAFSFRLSDTRFRRRTSVRACVRALGNRRRTRRK